LDMLCLNTVKHSSTTSDNIRHSNTRWRTRQKNSETRSTMTYDDGQRHTMNNERRTVDGNERNTEKQNTQQWSKISTGLENGLLLKNAAQIFRATAKNWASRTHTETESTTNTAHSKHSKRSYALFLRSANSNTAAQCYEQRVGRYTACSTVAF